MINIGICDDQPQFIEELQNHIQGYDFKEEVVIHAYTDPEDMIRSSGKIRYDILFMDILLGNDTNGLDVAEQLKRQYYDILIIYVSSAAQNYLRKMVDCEPFGCIFKPVEECRLFLFLDKAYERIVNIRQGFPFSFQYNGIERTVDLQDVSYFGSKGRIIWIKMSDGSTDKFYGKLDEVQAEVGKIIPCFARANKSCLVNLIKAKKSGGNLKIESEEIKISRSHRRAFDDQCVNYMHTKLRVKK